MLEQIKNRFGRLNVLVNNAGVAPTQRTDILEGGVHKVNASIIEAARPGLYPVRPNKQRMVLVWVLVARGLAGVAWYRVALPSFFYGIAVAVVLGTAQAPQDADGDPTCAALTGRVARDLSFSDLLNY